MLAATDSTELHTGDYYAGEALDKEMQVDVPGEVAITILTPVQERHLSQICYSIMLRLRRFKY
jgi:hypothetical protein